MFKSMLLKEFLLVFRDKHALAALFIMPAVFILIMSLALKDVFNEHKAMLDISLFDQDSSSLSQALVKQIQDNRLITSTVLEQAALQSVDKQAVQFMVVIPKGFAEQGEALQVAAAADVSQSVLLLFKAQMMQMLMQQKFDDINQQQQSAAKLHKQPIPESIEFNEAQLLEVRYSSLADDKKPTSTQQSVPSWIVFALFFVIIPMSTIFISERKQNTLMRLTAMNITIPALFAGKIIPYMLINQVQVWLMICVGIFIVPLFGADALTIGDSISALVILSLALSLAAIGLSILIATVVDSVEQATTIGGILNVLLGAIGGVMVPKFVMPAFMQEFANVSPMSWGLEGFLDLFLRNGNISDIVNESLALALFGLISLLIAAIIFKIKIRKVT
ncbi:MAG: ABC transporter permease [Psychromonas sp.]|nr:ABC transporter permease [Psychromonas sp.]